MEIAVIIPARDAERVLPRTLAALSGAPEVIVVDNGSRDATAAVALAAGARVVHEPRPSRPGARNAGARATTAPRLAFLDADCEPRPGWLAALGRCLDHAPLVGGRIEMPGGTTRWSRFDAAWRFRQRETIERAGWAVSANLALTRELFDDLGGFDEAYTHSGEDVDLCLRARARGAPPVYCADAVVRDAAGSSLRSVVQRGFRHGYASTQLYHRRDGFGRRDWRHPRPLVAGDGALRGLGIEGERSLLWPARADYAGRVAGSAWAELRRRR
jgi:GT2 family glycosyltransferase